jgi:subtilisin family serine protease
MLNVSGSVSAPASANVVAATTNDYIFTLQPGVDGPGLARQWGLKPERFYGHAINGFVAWLPDGAAKALARDPRVIAIERDGRIVPSGGACLFNYPNGQQIIPDGLVRMGITNFPVAQMHGLDYRINVNVAIVDTGVDLYNYDLNLVQAVDFTGDLNGAYDWNGHGTHVAGTIGALDNGYGLVGVAPGVKIWDLAVLGPTNSNFGIFLAALDFVVQHSNEIEVVNASLQGFPDPTNGSPEVALEQAVSNVVSRGIVFVAAAGNGDGLGALRRDVFGLDGVFGTADDILPAALPEALTVSAICGSASNSCPQDTCAGRDTLAPYSNFSRTALSNNPVQSPGKAIDLAAPGTAIPSLYPGEIGAYDTGTSMACAHVSGLVALYIAANGRAHSAADVYRIRQALIDNGLPQSQWQPSGGSTLDPDGNPEPLAVASENWIPRPEFLAYGRSNDVFAMSFAVVPGYQYTVQSAGALGGVSVWSDFTTVTSTPTWITNNPAYTGVTAYGSGFTNVAPYFAVTNVTVIAPLDGGSHFYRLKRSIAP